MRTLDEILATARDVASFSNGTEGYGWMENWCYAPCMNPAEVAWQRYEDGKRKTPPKDFPGGCPLIMAAMIGKTPIEWPDQWDGESPYPIDRYHCVEFRGPDDGDGRDPRPRPRRDPPNMDPLFEAPPRSVRLLTQPQPEPVRQPVGVVG